MDKLVKLDKRLAKMGAQIFRNELALINAKCDCDNLTIEKKLATLQEACRVVKSTIADIRLTIIDEVSVETLQELED